MLISGIFYKFVVNIPLIYSETNRPEGTSYEGPILDPMGNGGEYFLDH